MNDFPRLIEHAFPLKQASLDSVHEKNVRHGHISTLHIWPARRPLAASRAALIATLLPDPGTPEKRRELCEKIGGKVVKRIERKKMPNGQVVDRVKEETEGGILHWGREIANAADLEWFRQEIRKAYGGRAPKVLDPFAGGGAIPLEVMRLGCEATAVDINPVAWFILKCTLEYPQKLAGQKRPLPAFILKDKAFMESFFTAQGMSKAQVKKRIEDLGHKLAHMEQMSLTIAGGEGASIDADLAWHVRAWGQWVLASARRELATFYPTYADFEPLKPGELSYEHQPMRLVPLKPDGAADIKSLNAESSADYLAVKANPRWIAKPTVAYLWARAVPCKNCRTIVPLLKTRWLSKKESKRVIVNPCVQDDGSIAFAVEYNAPVVGGNAAQRREHDIRAGAGTMSRAGAKCLRCGAIQTHQDIQMSAVADVWTTVLVAVVVDGASGKEYREATPFELAAFVKSADRIKIPLTEPISSIRPSPNARGLSGLTRYGITEFRKVFNQRQMVAIDTFASITNASRGQLAEHYGSDFAEAIACYLASATDRLTDRNSTLCHWNRDYEKITGTFQRYALRVNWDYAEVNPFAPTTGNYIDAVEWIAEYLDHSLRIASDEVSPEVHHGSATQLPTKDETVDLVLTDPPYYDAIPYADLSDYYYVWLKRSVGQLFPGVFATEITVKEQELIQHAGRADGNNRAAKQRYEDGMASAFLEVHRVLKPEGRFVVVFAHKHPDAWETLVSAIIRAGLTVDASWPIQTEMPHKAAGGARLASSVWLVCKKRSGAARVGWDTGILEEMRSNIAAKLQAFWDAGIRGPDFIWAATGPALEAYSKHPAVKKADQPGQLMTVAEFLHHVRRLVVDYVVGKVLSGEDAGAAQASAGDRLDEPTAYYLLHRNDFGLNEAPAGTCILYAVSCGLSDSDLVQTWDLLARSGTAAADDDAADEAESDEADGDDDGDAEETSGKVRLKTWSQRRHRSMGYEAPSGRGVPLIDRVHRLMHLWKSGDLQKVDEYLDEHGLRRHELFKRLLQSLIEISRRENQRDELQLLESLSNHLGIRGARLDDQRQLEREFERIETETKE
jgi:putative DNA methylase